MTGPQKLFLIAARAESESAFLGVASELIRKEFQADAVDLVCPEEGHTMLLRASSHMPEAVDRLKIGRGVGLVGHVAEDHKPIHVEDHLEEDHRYAHSPEEPIDELRSAACAPLMHGTEFMGAILLRRRAPWPEDEAETKRLLEWTNLFGQLLSVFHHAHELGARSSRLGAVTEVSRTLASSPYLEEILQLLVTLTAQRFHYKVVTVRLLDEKRNELILRATQATNKAYQNKRAIMLGESIAGRVMREGKPIIVRDVQTDPDYVGHDLAKDQGLRSMICLPLSIQRRNVGVISCYTDEVRDFSADEIAALEALSKQAAVSIEHAKLQVRNTLMQEMHHRVKNNLQQVASLLRLQIRQSHYKDPAQALTDSLSRILAIASVHDLLSREDLDHVGTRSLAEVLVQHVQHSVILPGKSISFSVRADEVFLNTNQATQIALIMNELLQNAVEHGFKSTDEGEIHVTIEAKAEEIGLWVSNNGDKLPEDFKLESGRLGLQIIQSLVRSLGGDFKIEDRLGWTVSEVRFARARAE